MKLPFTDMLSARMKVTKHPNVFTLLQGCWYPFHSRNYDKEREEIIEYFTLRSSKVLLWLKKPDEDLMNYFKKVECSGSGVVIFDIPNEMLVNKSLQKDILSQLYEGAWALFFLPKSVQNILNIPEFLPIFPNEVMEMTLGTGAIYSIMSWYDDNEWTIAFSNRPT